VHVGILGGTGPAGRGVGLRLADAGVQVTIGSRDAERAKGIVEELRARWADRTMSLEGAGNADAAEADLVIVATPWDSAIPTVHALREPLRAKVVI
jgi:8-hydroxy-5-deazaflavin:NADPH oxidoreductase